jgi:hypothetical protein
MHYCAAFANTVQLLATTYFYTIYTCSSVPCITISCLSNDDVTVVVCFPLHCSGCAPLIKHAQIGAVCAKCAAVSIMSMKHYSTIVGGASQCETIVDACLNCIASLSSTALRYTFKARLTAAAHMHVHYAAVSIHHHISQQCNPY